MSFADGCNYFSGFLDYFKHCWNDYWERKKAEEKPMAISPASVTTGMPNTTATFYGAKKPKKKVKKVPKKK
jgi:hypothetical protein